MTALAWICAALTLAGVAQGLIGAWLARRFVRTGATWEAASAPITVLKPLHGDEPLLAKALASLCEQDYPPGFQIVCGVGDASDTAIPVVRAIQDRYPAADIALVVDATRHGANPKVGNLINMLPAARHDLLVIADSDVHVRPGYLKELAAALARPGVGLATVLYAGLPPAQYRVKAARVGAAQVGMGWVGMGWVGMGWVGALGATQITHGFLPSALLARALGRRDCLGATMALRRETLERIGGLETLKDHLADDNVLGRRVRAQGMDIALAGRVYQKAIAEGVGRFIEW